MKMADNSLMIFKNNFKSINSNCVEVESNVIAKISSDDNEQAISINESEDGTINISSDVSTQEEAVEEYLAGNNKTEFNDEFLACTNVHDGISFKSENVLEIDNDDDNENLILEKSVINLGRLRKKCNVNNYMVRNLKKRSIRW